MFFEFERNHNDIALKKKKNRGTRKKRNKSDREIEKKLRRH
jgi:hypothetical protein